MDKWVKKVKCSIDEEETKIVTPISVQDDKKANTTDAVGPLLSSLITQCHPSWQSIVLEESKKDYFSKIITFLSKEPFFYPPTDSVFRAFSYFDITATKAVILGQDPYHGKGQAMGLSFSVNKGVSVPPSLRNIYKEINSTVGYPNGMPKHGSLVRWAEQGVLLLNATLTVAPSKPGSHFSLEWHKFTDRIIREVNDKVTNCVFILWGNDAIKKRVLVDASKHLILTSAHPSPFSAHRGFFGCNHFNRANEYLKLNEKEEIAWQEY